MAKLFPGELFVVENVDGQLVNRWAVWHGNGTENLNAFIPDPDMAANNPEYYNKNTMLIKTGTGFPTRGMLYPELESKWMFISDLGFRKETFNGKECSVLKVSKVTYIYNTSGNAIGTIPAGTEILINDGTAGYTKRHLIAAEGYIDQTTGEKKLLTGTTRGFVDTGILENGTARYFASLVCKITQKYTDLDFNSEILNNEMLSYGPSETQMYDFITTTTDETVSKNYVLGHALLGVKNSIDYCLTQKIMDTPDKFNYYHGLLTEQAQAQYDAYIYYQHSPDPGAGAYEQIAFEQWQAFQKVADKFKSEYDQYILEREILN